jgi:hypothetical protein
MSTRAPVRPFCGIRLADHRPKLLGWDEILQAFATAAIGRSVRPVHQGERTSVPLLRRSVAPAKAGRGTRGSHPVDGWRRESGLVTRWGSIVFDQRSSLRTRKRILVLKDGSVRQEHGWGSQLE